MLATRSDGQVIAFGDNSYGQCDPPVLGAGQTIVDYMAYGRTSYYFLDDGSVAVIGETFGGQAIPPSLPSGVGYVKLAQRSGTWLALRTDGEVVAWGDNSHGECNVPPLPPGTVYTAIAAGDGHSHAARSDGVIVQWGQLWGLPLPPAPVLPPGVQCTQMQAGQLHMIGLLSTGKVVTWGVNWFFQGYVPSLQEEQGSNPTPLQFVDCSVDGDAAMAILSDGRLVQWGNAWPVPPALIANQFLTKARCGYWHNAVMTDAGEVLAWGDNSYGKATIPPLPAGTTYTDFECSTQNTVLLRSDGEALVVGSNSDGQLNVPPLPAGLRYVKCDTHERRTVLLRSDGEVFSFGRVASLSTSANVVPPLPAGLVYTDIAASKWFNSALRSDGTVVMFGSLGTPAQHFWRDPEPLPFGVYVVEVDGGEGTLMMRLSDGTVDVAGNVYYAYDTVPVSDPGSSYVQVSGGYQTVMARIGAETIYVGTAPGCAGSRPATKLVPRDTPKIGRTLEVTLFDLPSNVALLAMSFAELAQPVSLAPLGMPGCEMRIAPDATAILVGQNNQANWALPIPDEPLLFGLEFFNQALVLDPQAGNGFGAVVSDTMRGVVGDR